MVKDSLSSRLYGRELSDSGRAIRSYRRLYTDRSLVEDLDIVNELDGHSGCVNALSWSKSGRLLASGSDDQHLNIHTYQPTGVNSQFQLTATVATGHTNNIFSVKFMPHSRDATVITAAGDGEVRIFDLEYAGQVRTASAASSMASEGRRRGRNSTYNGVRYLSDGDTDCRVYRSHGDRVKRIVTESSPHLFLTCSEDGEVRQWDLRLPSSAYPAPRSGSRSGVPAPLISYKRYNLDLNSISCSASQPHYIALGGAHLHAFLHDRRMSGRDRLQEEGKPLRSISELSTDDQEVFAQATRCVRRFAPKGQAKMSSTDNGHITALKISDARPNEMIVSWSGDHIYSFDLVRDAEEDAQIHSLSKGRTKESQDRKRKRKVNGSQTSLTQDGTNRAQSRPRTRSAESGQDTALRIRYRNGQTEDVPLAPQTLPTEAARNAERIARASVKIRRALFSSTPEDAGARTQATSTLGLCASILSDMDEIMRNWHYPMEPSPAQIYAQRTLRRHRESTRRFVQAAGTVARVLGGNIQTSSGVSSMITQFGAVELRTNDLEPTRAELFDYDLIKAILIWLDSGIGRLIESFTRPESVRARSKTGARLPIPLAEATTEAVDEYLIPYLLALAGDEPIVDVEKNRFETRESRQLFPNKKAAVVAFSAALRIPFADLSSDSTVPGDAEVGGVQDRATACRYWAGKVARGLLLDAARGLSAELVNRAFGGLGGIGPDTTADEASLDLLILDTDEEETEIEDIEFVSPLAHIPGSIAEDTPIPDDTHDVDDIGTEEQTNVTNIDDTNLDAGGEQDASEDEDDDDDGVVGDGDDDEGEDEDEDDADESTEPDEEDGVPNLGLPRFIYRSAFERRRNKPQVERAVPCFPPTRSYRGHCNVRTVKDVNYFGPNDEYVVSGSDDGNLFIWDRASSRLVNLLEGDGEVVNVVQGHPYETMLAVSGIDHTIKIFSPDARARKVARLGQEVSAHDAASFSSLSWPIRRGARRIGNRIQRGNSGGDEEESTPGPASSAEGQAAAAEDDDDYVAPTGLVSRKRMQDAERIMQNNARDREDGNQDAVITREVLAQLAERIRIHRAVTGQMPAPNDDDDSRLVMGDNCEVQ